MYCSNCGRQINDNATFCEHCGLLINQQNPNVYQQQTTNNSSINQPFKSQFVAIVSCLFFGYIGLHNFYLEEYIFGLFKLGFFILALLSIFVAGDIISFYCCLLSIFLCNCGDFILILGKINPLFGSGYTQKKIYSLAILILSSIFYISCFVILIYDAIRNIKILH